MGFKSLDIKNIQNIQINSEGFSAINSKESPALPINFKTSSVKIEPDKLKKEDLNNLLKNYGEDDSRKNKNNISELQFVTGSTGENNALSITYKNGSIKQKIINKDLSYETITDLSAETSDGAQEVRKSYTKDNILLKEKIIKQNYSCETFFDSSNKKIKTIETDNEKSSVTTTLFDESEAPQSKEIKSGSTIQCFDFGGEGGKERITQKICNRGLPIEEKEVFSYTDNGNVKIEHYSSQVQTSSDTDTSLHTFSTVNNMGNNNYENNNVTIQYCSASNFDQSSGAVKDNSLLCSSERELKHYSSTSSAVNNEPQNPIKTNSATDGDMGLQRFSSSDSSNNQNTGNPVINSQSVGSDTAMHNFSESVPANDSKQAQESTLHTESAPQSVEPGAAGKIDNPVNSDKNIPSVQNNSSIDKIEDLSQNPKTNVEGGATVYNENNPAVGGTTSAEPKSDTGVPKPQDVKRTIVATSDSLTDTAAPVPNDTMPKTQTITTSAVKYNDDNYAKSKDNNLDISSAAQNEINNHVTTHLSDEVDTQNELKMTSISKNASEALPNSKSENVQHVVSADQKSAVSPVEDKAANISDSQPVASDQGMNVLPDNVQRNSSANQKISEDIEKEINALSIQFEKCIEQYAQEFKLSISEVKNILGVPANIDAKIYLQSVLNGSSSSNKQSINDIINNFKTLFKNNGKNNIEIITIKLNEIVKENNKSVIDNKSIIVVNHDDYVDMSYPKTVPDLNVFCAQNGIKTTELISEIKTMKPGDSKIVINAKSGRKSYRIMVNAKGEVLLTEIRRKTESERTESEKQAIISEYSYAIPSELRQKLANCKTTADIKKFVEDYIDEQIKSNKIKPVTVNPVTGQQSLSENVVSEYIDNTSLLQTQADKTVNKVSLNLDLKKELENILSTGKYKNSNGRIISINSAADNSEKTDIQNSMVVDASLENTDKTAEKLQQVIIEITKKYMQSDNKEKAIINNVSTKDKSVTANNIYKEEIEKLRERINNMLIIGIPDVQVVAFIASLIYSSSKTVQNTYVSNENKDRVTANEEL